MWHPRCGPCGPPPRVIARPLPRLSGRDFPISRIRALFRLPFGRDALGIFPRHAVLLVAWRGCRSNRRPKAVGHDRSNDLHLFDKRRLHPFVAVGCLCRLPIGPSYIRPRRGRYYWVHLRRLVRADLLCARATDGGCWVACGALGHLPARDGDQILSTSSLGRRPAWLGHLP